MILFMNKIEVTTHGDMLRFRYPDQDQDQSWCCYPTFDLETEDFLNLMTPIMQKHGWITPYDLQEQACKVGYATYSKR